MTPRRVLPFLLVFLVLAGVYSLVQWREARKESREEAAKKLFAVKEGEVTTITLKRGNDEIRLARTGDHWEITKPIKTKADPVTVDSMLTTLAFLAKSRDLGVEKDLQAFGLAKPGLVVEFTAGKETHRLVIGAKTPGDQGYYALKDQEPQMLTISGTNKESLDRPLTALRDRTLFSFNPDQVKALKIKMGPTLVDLERTGPQTWRWVGRDRFQVRRDRVEAMLRQLHFARVRDFVAEAPKDLRRYGLTPQPATEITVVLEDRTETLALGGKTQNDYYARKLPAGPVVLVDQNFGQQLTRSLASLEERRLWPGQLSEVAKVVWGAPPDVWEGLKDKDFFNVTGPQKQSLRQPAVQVEMALIKLQQLEYTSRKPANPDAGKPGYSLTLFDGSGKELLRLAEVGRPGPGKVELLVKQGDKTEIAVTSQAAFEDWQASMAALTKKK